MTDRRAAVAVAVGGAVGAGLRWATAWPLLAVNVAGCAVLGLVGHRPGTRNALLAPGLCGGFTTLSGVAVRVAVLLRDGRPGRAGAELAAHVLLGTATFVVTRAAVRPRT